MATKTLKIKKVNFKKLERQRKSLSRLVNNTAISQVLEENLTSEEITDVLGILALLDEWSDVRFFKKCEKENKDEARKRLSKLK